ncbi:MAG: uncharacterized protein JWR85_3843, partial [Marmoricola sp.]|nr:uncharacterized protein [Marmoricola sp.]
SHLDEYTLAPSTHTLHAPAPARKGGRISSPPSLNSTTNSPLSTPVKRAPPADLLVDNGRGDTPDTERTLRYLRRSQYQAPPSVSNVKKVKRSQAPIGLIPPCLPHETYKSDQDDFKVPDSPHSNLILNAFKHNSSKPMAPSDPHQLHPLQLPKPHDTIWRQHDATISSELQQILPSGTIRVQPAEKSLLILNRYLYDFFATRYPYTPRDTKSDRNQHRNRNRNRNLNRVRQEKNALKKRWRVANRNGPTASPATSELRKDFLRLVRLHNKMRTQHLRQVHQKSQVREQRWFRKDPHKFAHKLFNGEQQRGLPTFGPDVATAYFRSTYSDSKRDNVYTPPPGLPRPPLPKAAFNLDPLTIQDLKKAIRNKRNKSKPGLNQIPYVIFKKCPSTLMILVGIFQKCLAGDIPPQFGKAYMVLLAKTKDTSNPDLFRNIALTNTDGKLFFSVMTSRLTDYMLRNQYINKTVQKGFLPNVAGCIEHTAMLHAAFKNAQRHGRQIVTTWLDLQNAYGSIRHNLIQFALEWYHVPDPIRTLISTYYELLLAQVVTADWKTDFFSYDIGLFQGCVLSVILFDVVFNLLLDFISDLRHLGYVIKEGHITVFHKAYADDLTIVTRTVQANQLVLDKIDAFLQWTDCMRAKPSKCRCLARKSFVNKRDKTKPFTKQQHSSFDPGLSIAQQAIEFIKDSPFKFLGRQMFQDLSEKEQAKAVMARFLQHLQLVDGQPLTGAMKLWLYQHYIVSYLFWPFLVYDFPLTFAKDMEKTANRFLKRWIGLCKTANTTILYRSRANKGLQLSSPSLCLVRAQVSKASIIKHCSDPDMRALYQVKLATDQQQKRIWKPTVMLEQVESSVDHTLKFGAPKLNRGGLGLVPTDRPHPGSQAYRKLVSEAVCQLTDQDRLTSVMDFAMQGAWTKWDQVESLDFNWTNLLYGLPPKLLSFALNATQLTLPTPDRLRVWGKTHVGACKLCSKPNASLYHILCNCSFSLHGGRYSWRHDSVLHIIQAFVKERITEQNKRVPQLQPAFPAFVRAGARPPSRSHKQPTSALSCANDWQLQCDYKDQAVMFPPVIVATSLRPDMVIWSEAVKTVIIMELTVPSEDAVADAAFRKTSKYQ